MRKIIIGIDPGKKGAIVVVRSEFIDCYSMPLIGKDLDEKEINRILDLSHREGHKVIAFIEKVHAMPGQGVTSMFNFGMGYGMLRMALTANSIPYQLVTPQAWKKVILAGLSKDKSEAINYIARKYPDVNLMPGRKRVLDSGIADALCIAEYGKYLQGLK